MKIIFGFLLYPFKAFRAFFRRLPAKFTIKQLPWDSIIRAPFQIRGGGNIHIGHGVNINKYSWLDAVPITNSETVELRIGDRVRMSFYMHIIASHRVVIGNNVNCGNGVYIADNAHNYEDIDVAPRDQPVKQLADVVIGDDTWLGEHSIILGCKIGKHCVIGSHALVNRDIPDYCVAVGAPAKIVKRYDFEAKKWRKTDPKGAFVE